MKLASRRRPAPPPKASEGVRTRRSHLGPLISPSFDFARRTRGSRFSHQFSLSAISQFRAKIDGSSARSSTSYTCRSRFPRRWSLDAVIVDDRLKRPLLPQLFKYWLSASWRRNITGCRSGRKIRESGALPLISGPRLIFGPVE